MITCDGQGVPDVTYKWTKATGSRVEVISQEEYAILFIHALALLCSFFCLSLAFFLSFLSFFKGLR